MYHPKITIATLYHHFKPYLHWNWLNENKHNLANPPLLCNKLSLPMASHFNLTQPALIYIVDKHNIHLFLEKILSLGHPGKIMPSLIVLTENTGQQLHNQLCTSAIADINIPIFTSSQPAQTCLDFILPYCYQQLSPRIIQHGTFINIMGKGVLLTGKSGVGKSLAALYCLKNNHALIADDAPFFYKHSTKLIGSSPTKLANLLEIRNLGIIDVSKSYGPQFIRSHQTLDMIIALNSEIQEKRLTTPPQTTEIILGIPIPKLSLPFTENVAILIENAVRCLYTNQIFNS